MNDDEMKMYRAVKASVLQREQEKKDAENARRASEGLPPRKLCR